MKGASISRILGSDKPPFFLAIFVAALAWSITHYADSITSTPVIEFDLQNSGDKLIVSLENLTQSKKFSNLIFLLRAPGGSLVNPSIEPTLPAWEGTIRPNCDGETCRFLIQDFQPGWKFKLTASLSRGAKTSFQLVKSSDTIRLLA